VLIKDNLIKRNWHGNKTCCFCHEEETIQHLFFYCRSTRFIWSFSQVAPKCRTYVRQLAKWCYKTSKIYSSAWGSCDLLVYLVTQE
jgi:hypothetical protein